MSKSTDSVGPRESELTAVAAEMLQASRESSRPNAHLLPVEEARKNFDSDFAAVGPGEEVAEVFDVTIPVSEGSVTARVLRPGIERPLPGIVYFHGGGWLLGSIESHDVVTRALANASGAVVLNVAYRRGPESRFPTAVADAYSALSWLASNAGDVGVDAELLAVAGDSAGGNLAVAVAILARERGGPDLRFQLLAYPVTTTDLDLGFDPDFEGYFLYRDEMQWHQDNYLAEREQRTDALVSPLEHADLRGLPPAMVLTAGCDPLHRQGELFADALIAAGVATEHLAYPGVVHGFFQLPGIFPEGRDAIDKAGAALRDHFGKRIQK